MTQTDITKYLEYSVPSATSPKLYTVTLNPPSCKDQDGNPCEFRKHHPSKPCRHILEAVNSQLYKRCAYLESRNTLDYSEEWESFEQALAAFQFGNGEEFNYICNLIMALAFTNGRVDGDMVAWSLNQEYTPGGNKRLSAAWAAMARKGLIIRIGTKKSEREQNHGSDQGIYELTETGRRLMPNKSF